MSDPPLCTGTIDTGWAIVRCSHLVPCPIHGVNGGLHELLFDEELNEPYYDDDHLSEG